MSLFPGLTSNRQSRSRLSTSQELRRDCELLSIFAKRSSDTTFTSLTAALGFVWMKNFAKLLFTEMFRPKPAGNYEYVEGCTICQVNSWTKTRSPQDNSVTKRNKITVERQQWHHFVLKAFNSQFRTKPRDWIFVEFQKVWKNCRLIQTIDISCFI